MSGDQKLIREEIRGLIRGGMKTSAIIALGRFSTDVIKAVKSEELEADKAGARELAKEEQRTHLANKREKHHQAFMKRMGIAPKQAAPTSQTNTKTGWGKKQ